MTNSNRRNKANEIQIAPLAKWLMMAFALSLCGLLFVYVKNQQHFLGEQTREVERSIRELKERNEFLVARISALTSWSELQRKLDQKIIVLQPIKDSSIARMMPPAVSSPDGLLRTAANERLSP